MTTDVENEVDVMEELCDFLGKGAPIFDDVEMEISFLHNGQVIL